MAVIEGKVDNAVMARGLAETQVSLRLVAAVERVALALERIAGQATTLAGTVSSSVAQPSLLSAGDSQQNGPPSLDSVVSLPVDRIVNMESQIAEIRELLRKQARQARAGERKSYTVDEVAELTEFKPWTIRDACNNGRIKADKGPDRKWRISQETLLKIQDEGLPRERPETASP